MIDVALLMACAPNVAPATMQEIIRVESSGNPLAVNINKKPENFRYPKIKTVQDAVTLTKAAMTAGYTVDMGYMQLNSANLKMLGYTVEDAFEPCKNLAGGAKILSMAYAAALPKHKNEQAALRAALSVYNTGNATRGFQNGYVARYVPSVTPAAPKNAYTAGTSISFTR